MSRRRVDAAEVYERAREGSPFSNSTMGDIWMARWCDRCLRDAPWRNNLKGAIGCPILAAALCGRTPAEWVEQPESEVVTPRGYNVANLYHCTEFREPGAGTRRTRRRKPPLHMESLFT